MKQKLLNIKGETLGNAHFAIEYLRSPQTYRLGSKVVVIGAGNVAMDAARTAKRNGSDEVTIVYRKDFAQMKATKKEIQEAKEDGINFRLLASPKEFASFLPEEEGAANFVLLTGQAAPFSLLPFDLI